MKHDRSLIMICMILFFFTPMAVLAQTPDTETPSFETICDSDVGAAFGLCNAYCEAMDCETDDPQASPKACERVHNKYVNVTGHEPPCVKNECPCLTLLQEQTDWFTTATDRTSCSDNCGSPSCYIEHRGPSFLLLLRDEGPFMDACFVKTRTGATGGRPILPDQFDDCVALFGDPIDAASCFP